MKSTNAQAAPRESTKLLFRFGYQPWMWLYGRYRGRWRLRRPIFMIGCPRSGTSLAGRLPRGIARLTDDEHFDGAIRAARVEAVGAVTAEALRQLARLTEAALPSLSASAR